MLSKAGKLDDLSYSDQREGGGGKKNFQYCVNDTQKSAISNTSALTTGEKTVLDSTHCLEGKKGKEGSHQLLQANPEGNFPVLRLKAVRRKKAHLLS